MPSINNQASLQRLIVLEQAELIHKFSDHSKAVAISPDEEYVAFNNGTLVLIHSLPLMERRCVGQASDVPVQLAFTKSGNKCYILTRTKLLQVMTFDTTNRKCQTKDVISDLQTVEFTLSHKEEFVLVRALRCLYLVCTRKQSLLHRLMRAPNGVFVETMTSFTGAGFSPGDDMVVASRYTYIFVWSTKTGDPIRVLQASLSPILKIYTSDTVNKAVALLQDNTLQVWNLDNIDANILHSNEIVKGRIKSLAVSCKTETVLCHDAKHSEVKIVDLFTGKTTGALVQEENVECVSSVLFCFNGQYAVTRNTRCESDEEEKHFPRSYSYYGDDDEKPAIVSWNLLNDDVIWSMKTQKSVFKLKNNRFAVQDRQQTVVGFVTCTFHSVLDWPSNLYSFTTWKLKKGEVKEERMVGEESRLDFPDMCEFICPPVIHTNSHTGEQIVAALLQVCQKTLIGTAEGSRKMDNILYIQNLSADKKTDSKTIRLSDMLKFCNDKDKLAHVEVVNSNLLLLNYVKGVDHFSFDNNKGLIVPAEITKGGVLYDPVKGQVIRHLPAALQPNSDLTLCIMSSKSSYRIDNHLQVFDTLTSHPRCRVKADLDPLCIRLALDGQYIVGLDSEKRSVTVYRTSDGHRMGQTFIHGRASCIEIGEDDRTVVVGCCDGRVLILSLILGLSDPYKELIQKLPYRSKQAHQKMLAKSGDSSLLDQDIAMANSSKQELIRLSSKIRSDVKVAIKKQASFKSIVHAVTSSRNASDTKSRACCIQ